MPKCDFNKVEMFLFLSFMTFENNYILLKSSNIVLAYMLSFCC